MSKWKLGRGKVREGIGARACVSWRSFSACELSLRLKWGVNKLPPDIVLRMLGVRVKARDQVKGTAVIQVRNHDSSHQIGSRRLVRVSDTG